MAPTTATERVADAATASCTAAVESCAAAVAGLEAENWRLKCALFGLVVLVTVGIFVREIVDEREKATLKQR